MNPRMLWCTELPPVLDVTRGPINGAAHPEQAEGVSTDSVVGAIASEGVSLCRPADVAADAAAPPSSTPADSEGAADTTTPSQEGPGTEREGAAWVPWDRNNTACPVGKEVHGYVRFVCGKVSNQLDKLAGWMWGGDGAYCIDAYRLANPRPRGPCTLPPDHPHAELARLYMSDDTLRAWWLNPAYLKWVEAIAPVVWAGSVRYHVGHVPPKEAA